MGKKVVEKDATVTKVLTGGMFRLELDDTGEEAIGVISGKIRKFRIRILAGDRVKVEFSPHDLTRGRITYRYK
ncbi:translation initiation factor IF-1 [candidate division WWE3 bacterium]|nr:translation initiation factor IF-1 [candidate division WWE3 bacterium]